MKEFLYRGVSEVFFKINNGKLTPKQPGKRFASHTECGDETAQCGSSMTCGFSAYNEAVRHQFMQKGLPTSGISTTPNIERAKFYATKGGKYLSGHIYIIDRTKLSKFGVSEYIVNEIIPNPSIPEDNEVIIVAQDFKQIPKSVIIEIKHITL